jgi:hypothetical protein
MSRRPRSSVRSNVVNNLSQCRLDSAWVHICCSFAGKAGEAFRWRLDTKGMNLKCSA